MTLTCHMRQSMLEVSRTFVPAPDGSPVIKVTERLKNLVGTDRALGRSQHVTLGVEILGGRDCRFACNCDRGMTWPEDNGPHSFWAVGQEFDVPRVPRKDGGTDDWRRYPRCDRNSDLLTMRVAPGEELGWFTAARASQDSELALAYVWERNVFPWLMTWEENRARAQAPWSGRTLARGLEFGSYAMAMGRRWCVERGSLLGVPAFEWLDAFEEKETSFWISLQVTQGGASEPLRLQKVPGGLDSELGGFAIPLH